MKYYGQELNIQNIMNENISVYGALDELKKVCAKLCVLRNIPHEELEYCVKGLYLLKDTKSTTIPKCITIINDAACFFNTNSDKLFCDNVWVDEEYEWVKKIVSKTKQGDVIWKYSLGEFNTHDIDSIKKGRQSRTILNSREISHKFFSQSKYCPVFTVNSYELHSLVVKLDKESNQMSHLHHYH